MECLSCGHVSKEDAPKFCSECGHRLLPAAPVADPKNSSLQVTPAREGETSPEGETEYGQELREDGGPFLSPGSNHLQQENLDEPPSDVSGTVPRGVASEVCVDAAGSTSDEWEAVNHPPSKRRKEDATLRGVADTFSADPEQRKRKKRSKRKKQNGSASMELDSLAEDSSCPCSVSSPANPGFQDTAPPQSQDLQGGATSQPRQPPGADPTPLEGGGHQAPVGHAEAGGSPLHDQTPGGAVPNRKEHDTPKPSKASGLPQEGAGPTASASKDHPGKDGAARERPMPDSEPGSEPQKEPQSAGQQAGARAPGEDAAVTRPAEPVEGARKEGKAKTQKTKQPPASTPASSEYRQEAETKDTTAATGEKTGRNEKAKPEDPKKPEGSNSSYAAAVKTGKEQKNPKAAVCEVKQSPPSLQEGVTLYFHAIVSKHFGFDPALHKVFIRGGEEFGKPKWTRNVCEMHHTKDLRENGSLVEGSATLSRQHLDKPIPYKYVIMRGKGQVEYEFIYKRQQKEGEFVNRCLHVRPELLGSGEWHQYDDIVCMKPPGLIQRVMDHLTDGTRRELVRGKQIAATIMLDTIFSILQIWDAININSFFTQFQQFYSVVRVPMIYEGREQPWSALQYDENEVKKNLWWYLKKRSEPFLERSGDFRPEDHPVRSRLRMGLILLFSVETFDLPMLEGDLAWLCNLLYLDACSPGDLHRDLSHIFETRLRWRVFLVNLCRQCIEKAVDLWVLTLPVLHHCVAPTPQGKDSRIQPEDTWAALEGIPFSEFREKKADRSHLVQLMGKERHLLNVDEFLFRSWFSLLPLRNLVHYMENFMDHLSVFPTCVLDCLLGTWYRLQRLTKLSFSDFENTENTFQMLLHLLDIYQDRILEEPLVQSYLTVCLKLHETICRITKDPKFYELPALSAEIVRRIIILKSLVQPDSAEGPGKETGKKNSVKTVFQGTVAKTRAWLQSIFQESMFFNYWSQVTFRYREEIKVWRRLVEINFPVEYGWKESLMGDLEGRIKQERPLVQISAFCSTHWDAMGLEDSVSRCFEKCVIEAVSAACQSQTSILERISHHDLRKFGSLVSAVITKSWPRSNGQAVDDMDGVLTHLLTWPDVKHLFKLYETDEKVLANMTEDGKKLLATADSVFTKVTEDLLDGTVLVGHLELIMKHTNQFLDICQLKRKCLSPQEKKQGVKEVLEWRKEELKFLKKEKKCVHSLLKLCGEVKHLVKVDLEEVIRKHAEDLNGKRLSDAVTVRLSPASPDVKRTTHYSLSPQVQEMARKMDWLKDSHLFQVFWAEAARALSEPGEELEGQILQPEEAYKYLYCPCFEKYQDLYEDLKSGEITFQEVNVTFNDFVNKYNNLTFELQLMCALDSSDQRDWIGDRVGQIREYHHLHQAVSSAKVILKVKDSLGLTGDFRVLHTLLNFTDNFSQFRHEKLDRISKQLIQAKKLLQDITEPRCQCLNELSLRKEFISWVREALGGVHELKVFVDLASISAGENDIDVDRVACFHDAVQGYSPLLYKLDTSAGFDEFMTHLGELWRALNNDAYLPHKLCDSARNLEWLKTVKESHGSVELTSLSLATAINDKGCYIIRAPADGQKISPDTVLQLSLPESHGGREETRDFSLEELKELLNKLMLMSGKKDHSNVQVEIFSKVFCNVQRLVESFINLYAAGNMLFRNWTAQVHCSPRHGVSIQMDFRLEPVVQLKGSGSVAELLEAVSRQLEQFLDHWEAFVAEKRAKHFYLNYYTAEQLVYLSTELKKATPSDAALTMLSFIKGNCTPKDVAKALKEPRGEAARHEEKTVIQGLQVMLLRELSLAGKLRAVLEQSLACMSAFLPHCLDLEALGRCLALLGWMRGCPVERQLPKGLHVGRPNLIVCGHSEVLLAALAIYMHTPQQPLPTFDEVLLCTPATTLEEVALLLRRCLTPGSRGQGVYSLLYADLLSYEVASQAEALFLSLCSQPHHEDFQLVMVCDSEREHCHLPSAFSQHKVLVTPQAPLRDIQAYLAQHFQVPAHTPSAAEVFRDRTCVGIVASKRAGVGKSLYVERLHSKLTMKLRGENVPLKVIRLIDPQVDENQVLSSLLPFLKARYQTRPMIFHFDVTSSVQTGLWVFIFKLLILQYLMDINGKMWLRNPCHLYIIEILERTPAMLKTPSKRSTHGPQFSFLDIFPRVTCRPPKEVIDMELNPEENSRDPGMDQGVFQSETFQRPYQYLRRFHQKENLDSFLYQEGCVEGTPTECLQYFLIYCGVIDPSWSELRNFAGFLNYQLRDCEGSLFCNPDVTGDTLGGFKNFVVTFMIFMARDFATPTLHTSDQSPGRYAVPMDGVREEDLAPFTLRRRWESEPHPYVFFNGDHTSMTFIGFHIQPNQNGSLDAVDLSSRTVIKKDVMAMELYRGLSLQRVPFNVDFDQLPRHEKLERLCLALGIQWPTDPDETYELTMDNMLKILAIEMRFRCGIPVIIMGETGCGKTRLIKFLSDLRRGSTQAETMKLVKVHGGTTAEMIYSKVREAEELAVFNKEQHQLGTILFFDEANTTEAISCIKEVLCDRTVNGQPLAKDSGLHIIAACNPYRKHSQEMISRLEAAGLGYRVRSEDTAEKLGSTPLRQLVYRVHALPPSLIPLVWDFGQLNNTAEKLYIQQIVQRTVDSVGVDEAQIRAITEVLSASQSFMRKRGNECGFVSLRDVERCVRVFMWFYEHRVMLLSQLDAFLCRADVDQSGFERDPVLWSLVLALGVCYHASLEQKESYWKTICRLFPEPYNDSKVVLEEITRTQDLFLDGVSLRKTIARNSALKENVFMMVICIELKIPLFLVGKPGSSKSLAKTIVADAMQGPAAHSDLFRNLKQVHLVSFQCSPHSTPQGIISTFKQCARFQQGKDLQEYVSVVVLDEVGLAEDSPKMPLKALHPLLEYGCIEDDPAPHQKVGFIGISNWALDPAKMNRGIFVSRGSPSKKELMESAKGICSSEPLVQQRVQGFFAPFARAYETVCRKQDKEFFGLRDYYSLIKMVFARAKASDKEPSPQDIAQAVLRNFSGKDNIHALDIFMAALPEAKCSEAVSTIQLIEQNMRGRLQKAAGGEPDESESRYLLVLTRNYAALQVLQQMFFRDDQQPEIIFGSSFPRDQEYTQICRNINRVKICMETGKTVVLLNLQSLYESLYDALNQYYVYLGGQKYVDLGLGTHRVKCRVHPDFRLIVIEEKDVVYKQFPIPLINRLEKHYLDINTVLEKWQRRVVEELKAWVERFVDVKAQHFAGGHRYSPSEVFVGYHSDACASVVLQVTERLGRGALTDELYQRVCEEAKSILLGCATPDAVVRLGASSLGLFTAQALSREYYHTQQHSSFADFLRAQLRTADPEHHLERRIVFTEITTFSRLLTNRDCEVLQSEGGDGALKPMILSLQQFDTEGSFLREVQNCLTDAARCKILIIQTSFEDGVHSAQLIASAKYSAINEINKIQGNQGCVLVYFITKLSRIESGASFVGFHGGLWQSVHIDDLCKSTVMVSDVTRLQDVTISQLFKPEGDSELETGHGAGDSLEEPMETEDVGSEEAPGVDLGMEGSTAMGNAEQGGSHIMDTTSLLRSCIQSAVGTLRDQDGRQRSMRRVEILLGLLDEDDDDEVKAAFLRASKARLYVLLKQQEDQSLFNMKEWVTREASNQDALQEAGTFRQTLWKRVQGVVTPLLASMVSVLDIDSNLELLIRPDSPSWTRDLWMFIFRDIKLLNIPLVTNDMRAKSEVPYIMVQNYMTLPEDISNDVPFGWRIKGYLEELWLQAQYITGAEGLLKKLVEIFQQTSLGRFLAQLSAEQQEELFVCYIKDFLLLTMRVSTWEELRILQVALWSCICQLQAQRPQERVSLPWVHVAYQHFRSRLQNFSRIVTTYPQVLQMLLYNVMGTVRNDRLDGPELTLDAFAAMACTEMLTRDILKPSPQAWLQMVKNLSMPLELLCSDGYLQTCGEMARDVIREVRTQWNRIFPVALFVEHVLLGIESQIPELCELVTEYVFLLNKCLQENSDIKTYRPFVAVMVTLRKCKDQVCKTLARVEIQPCPVCLGDAQDPVCLPCDHVFCLACVKVWVIIGQMRCPLCLTDLPESFSPAVSQEHRNAIRKHACIRQMCNSFFIDLVSTICFKDNSPPEKEVIDVLLNLLFAQKELLRGTFQRHREHTKSLSPFDDVVDKTPVIRSAVLKLLLKYSFQEVKDYIQAYLSLLEKKAFLTEDKTELYILLSTCLEDSMYEKVSALSTSESQKCLREDGVFLETYSARRGPEPASEASVDHLQEMARIRLCLNRASDFLSGLQEGSEAAEDKQRYLQQVERFCRQVKNDWYRVYLVRKLASERGIEFVQRLSRPGHPARWVFPQAVLAQQEDHSSQMDRYLVHGDRYKSLRDAVGKAVLECKPLAIAAAVKVSRNPGPQQAAHLLLALFREVATLYRLPDANLHPKPEQREALNSFIEESEVLSHQDIKLFATSLVADTLPLLSTGVRDSSLEGTVAELAVHVAILLLCGHSDVLEPLRNLAFSPATMASAFLPTMPEDLLAQAQNWKGLEGVHWYMCPNGHPCSVGECGRPMEQSHCVDCGAVIGGINHRPEDGFLAVTNHTDRTQTGHVLGVALGRRETVVSDRQLAPAVFLLLRLLTHLAMLLGAAQSPEAVINIIKPPVRDPRGFLQQHIRQDLEQLTRTLGRSADEAINAVHLVLRSLLGRQRHPSGQRMFNFDARLSSREFRNSWEKAMQTLILPELEHQHLEKALLTVTTQISQDERISSNPVARIVYGDPGAFLPHLPQKSVVHCSKMWACRRRVTVEYLQHVVEQNSDKDTVPILRKFLQKEAELRLVKSLPEILALQRDLVKQFQNVSEADYQSIRAFISTHHEDGLKQLLRKRIRIFLSTWNKLRMSLQTSGEIKLPEEYCDADLDEDTDFEVILPRRRGRGLCSTALVSYLIRLHNEMVHAVGEFSGENNGYTVDASEVTDLHVISYEVERDLVPLILSNCQYRVEQGQETLQEFDLEKIQRQVTGRFLQGKPRLTLKGIPTLVHRRDWNYEHLFADIKSKMPQKPLHNAAISAICGQLQSYSDACEALSLIEVTLGFLSTAGGNPNMPLNVYVQDVLRMGEQTALVLKALHRCQLKHTMALWQLLSAHRSEQLLRLHKEPFREISARYKVGLSPDNAKCLRTFLNQTDLDSFLLELHEMMILKLKSPQAEGNFNPEWSLRDTLVSYMETKEGEIPPELEFQFPEEILLCSCVPVWRMATELKRGRQVR
ncbi:E3 ubiquitin-protein ligase RNF213 isoform X1 [Acinonyx jubatus]|uniref:E3 ubiquitin-protein ligase RNF213 isoform X1 n=2 Tax=Acinonyx jubatus TaxID=32536 RepID=A0A6J1YU30_ACIJB|nr:E3 ubiquitin-protein ligase RNF213 isoform X1 [Acinonyx jubatus]